MFTWLKKFWTDEAFFIAALRGLIALLGAGVATGIIPLGPVVRLIFGDAAGAEAWKAGIIAMAAMHFMPAGQQNVKVNGK